MPTPISLVHLVREPTVVAPGKPPLLLLLHGVGSHEGDLIGLADHLDGRFFIVSARAPVALGPGAFGWYPAQFTPEGPRHDPAQAAAGRQAVVQLIDELVAAYDLDPARVYLMGFSQGAIMSLSVALTVPRKIAGGVLMSGRLLPEVAAHPAPPDQLAGLPLLVVHGTADQVLPISEGRTIHDFLARQPVALTYREYPMAHQVTPQSLADIAAWLTARLDASSPS